MLRLRTALLLTIAFAVLAGVIAMRADRTSGSNVNPSAPWNVFFAGDFDGICFAELRLVGTTLAGTWDCGVFGAGSLSGPIEKSSQGWTFEVNGILTRAPALDFDMYVLGSISADATDIAGTWEAPLLGESGTFSGFRKGAPPPTATPSPTATPTPTSTPTVSPTPTISLTPTLSPTVTATSTASATLAPSSTPPPAATNTPAAPATPTPSPSVLGDVDCDGLVTSVDASLVLQYASGLLDSLPCLENGDINNNGQVNSVDAAIILTIVAGILPA